MNPAAIFLIIWIVFWTMVLIKNHVTSRMQGKIIDAIFVYSMTCLDKYDFVSAHLVEFDDMESYEKTLFRLWDWGYTRILPPEKFELIKPYIK